MLLTDEKTHNRHSKVVNKNLMVNGREKRRAAIVIQKCVMMCDDGA